MHERRDEHGRAAIVGDELGRPRAEGPQRGRAGDGTEDARLALEAVAELGRGLHRLLHEETPRSAGGDDLVVAVPPGVLAHLQPAVWRAVDDPRGREEPALREVGHDARQGQLVGRDNVHEQPAGSEVSECLRT